MDRPSLLHSHVSSMESSRHMSGAQMPSPDQPNTPPPPTLPAPPSGVGAADLATDSTDPGELRDLLDRARERLAFYESFDRIIGENIRRSGELMVETVSLREQAQAIANQSARERAQFEATRQADRDRYRSLIQNALDEAAAVRPVIDAMVERLHGVLDELNAEAGDSMDREPPTAVEAGDFGTVSITSDLVEPWSTSAARTQSVEPASHVSDIATPAESDTDATVGEQPAVETTDITAVEDAPEPATSGEAPPEPAVPVGPRTIDVLAHGVPNARIAISLQKMLRGLEVVSNVDVREFASGELRLAVTATGALPVDALTIWLTDNRGELTSTADTVTEITFREI